MQRENPAAAGHQLQAQLPSRLLSPPFKKTHPIMWLIAVCITLACLAVILAGLAILIIYLVFRPKYPRFEISSATLNGAYLDNASYLVGGTLGFLLNADITILANISNPNKKVDVRFGYAQLDLYFGRTMIATQAVEPFEERRRESALRDVHMVSSGVELPAKAAAAWREGAAGSGLTMEVVGWFRTRSVLAGWLRYTSRLRRRCNIVFGGPPSGALISSSCAPKH